MPDRQVARSLAPELDTDLSRLSPTDLARVRRWAEDRLINAITPLDIRLQMQMPGVMAADNVYREARRTVERILGIVEEVRDLAERKAHGAERRKADQETPDLMPLQNPKDRAI